jgi:hypothetical protein
MVITIKLIFLSIVIGVAITLSANPAEAGAVVTFYDNESKFLSALSSSQVFNFEGIAPDNGIVEFGPALHMGSITFTAITDGLPNDVAVVGKNSESLGAPYDSAVLVPTTDPGSLLATFDPGANITAAGGFFLNAFGSYPVLADLGYFKLTGATGVLDVRGVNLGYATRGEPKTFFGYTVTGDIIKSLAVNTYTGTAAFADFTFGAAAVPEPTSIALAGLAIISGAALAVIRRIRIAMS